MATEDTNLDDTTPEEFVPPHQMKGSATEKFASIISADNTGVAADPEAMVDLPTDSQELDEQSSQELLVPQEPAPETPSGQGGEEPTPEIPEIPKDSVEVDGVTGPARKVQQPVEEQVVDDKTPPTVSKSFDEYLKKGAAATGKALKDVGKEILDIDQEEVPDKYPGPDFFMGMAHAAGEGVTEFYGNLAGEGINFITETVEEVAKAKGVDISIPKIGKLDWSDYGLGYEPPPDRSFLGSMGHEIGTLGLGLLGGGPVDKVFKWGAKGVNASTKLIQGGSNAMGKVIAPRVPGAAAYMGSAAKTTKDKAYDLFVTLGSTGVGKKGKWVASKSFEGSKLGFKMDLLRTSHETVFDVLPPGMSKEFMRSDTMDRSIIEERLTQGFEGLIFGIVGGPALGALGKGASAVKNTVKNTEGYKHFVAFRVKPLTVKIHTAQQVRRLFANPNLTQQQIKDEISRIHADNLTGIKEADKAQKAYLKEQQEAAINRQKTRKQGRIEAKQAEDAAETRRAVDELYLNTKDKPGIEDERSVGEIGATEPQAPTTPKPKLERKALSRPHTMSPTEYIEKLGPAKVEEMGGIKEVMVAHKDAVNTALEEGRTVHKFIVDKYPDLKETHFGDTTPPELNVEGILRNLRTRDNASKAKTPDYHLRQFAKEHGIEVKDANGRFIKRGRIEEQIADLYGQPVGRAQGRRRAESTVGDRLHAVWTYTDNPELQRLLRESEDDPEFLEIVGGREVLPDNVVIADLENQFEMKGFDNVEDAAITAEQAREAGHAVTALQFQVTKRLQQLQSLNDEFQKLVTEEADEDTLVQMMMDIHSAQKDLRSVYANSEKATSEIAASLRRTQLNKTQTPFKSEGWGVIESREDMDKFLTALGSGDLNKGLKLHAKQQMHSLALDDATAIVQSDPSYAMLLTNTYSQTVINSMLSSPQTAIINAASPLGTIAIDLVESTVGNAVRGEGRRAWINAKSHVHYVTGINRALRIAFQTFKTNKSAFDKASRLNEPLQEGLESGNRVSARAGFDSPEDRTGVSNIFDWIALSQSGATRGLGAVDDFWKALIYQQNTRSTIEVNLVDTFQKVTQDSYERIRILADEGHETYDGLSDNELKLLARAEAEERVLKNRSIEEVAAERHTALMKNDGLYTHKQVGDAAVNAANEALDSGEIARSEYTEFLAAYMRDNYDESLVKASEMGLAQARRMTFTTPLEVELREGYNPSRPPRSSIPGFVGAANKSVEQLGILAPLARTKIPFVRTPYNILEWLTVRKPQYAIPKAGRELIRDLRGMHGSPIEQETARRAYGRAMTAMAMTYKAYDMALQGKITGNGPSNPETRKQYEETGWRRNSITFDNGKTYVPMSRFAPFLSQFMSAGDTTEYMYATHGTDEITLENLHQFVVRDVISLAGQIKEFPFLQGLSQEFKFLEGNEAQRAQIMRNNARQIQPYASGFRSFNTENVKREQQSMSDAFASNLSWTEGGGGPVSRTWMSKPLTKNKPKRGETWVEHMKDAFNPARVTEASEDDIVAKEIMRIVSSYRSKPRGLGGEYMDGREVESPFQPVDRIISIGGMSFDLKSVEVDVTETVDGKTSTNKATYWHLFNKRIWETNMPQDVHTVVYKNGKPTIKVTKEDMNVEEALENLFVREMRKKKLDGNGNVMTDKNGSIMYEVFNPYKDSAEWDAVAKDSFSKVTLINAVVKSFRARAKAEFVRDALTGLDADGNPNPQMEKMGLYFWLTLAKKVSGLKKDTKSVDQYFKWIDELQTGDIETDKAITELKNQVQLEITSMNK